MRTCAVLFFIFCCFLDVNAQGGAVLVINGGYINIENGARLVIDNPVDTAIKRTIAGGHIISEHENDIVRWNIGNRNGNYFVPFGLGTANYLPLRFNTTGGIGNGYFDLATYGGSNYLNTSYLPTGITNFTGFSSPDNSPYVMDRFWKIAARDYSSANAGRPNFSFLSLSYRDQEHLNPGNIINENLVFIQRYNPVLDTWYDYLPGGGSATVDVNNNTVSVPVVPNDEIFDWWVIVDQISPLPVELLSFTADAVDNKIVHLNWETASEQNSDKFIVERSLDGKTWEFVVEVSASGFSNQIKNYQGVDPSPYSGYSYYRLKQLDLDGSFSYSATEQVFIKDAVVYTTVVYPNPATNQINVQFSDARVKSRVLIVYDVQGKLLIHRDVLSATANNIVPIDVSRLAQGSYLIQVITDQNSSETYKFVKL